MLTKEKAIELAEKEVAKLAASITKEGQEYCLTDRVIEREFGWVFYWGSKPYIDTRNIRYAIAGNAPILVNKKTGEIKYLPTYQSADKSIEEYEKGLLGIHRTLRRVMEARETLPCEDAADLMRAILAGEASDVEMAALLGAMAARGETAQELAGFATVMRDAATMLPLSASEQEELVDSCGTGGDNSGTFNISTGAALVAAAAGAKVAKHGNRAVTSRCGSADVLEAMGIPVGLGPQAAADALRQHGFVFLLASAHHPAMRAVMPVRRALGVRTVFNVLGPLLNPAGARRQVMGVYAARLVPVVAEAMTMLGVRHAFVVHGDGENAPSGQDELALSGRSEVAEVREGTVRTYTLTPEDFGIERAPLEALAGGDAAENAVILGKVFAGERGPRRDAVVLNAAAVLVAAGKVVDMREGTTLAAAAIDAGAVIRLAEALRTR